MRGFMNEKKEEQKNELEIPKTALAKAQDQKRIRTDRFKSIYSNNMQVGISMWDMAITFGEIVGEEDGKVIVEELVQVKMTRELVKVLASILLANIKQFEAQTGVQIAIPVLAQGEETKDVETVDS
jgi:hypothetical protein